MRVSRHEAGHAVVAFAFKVPVRSIAAHPFAVGRDGHGGQTDFAWTLATLEHVPEIYLAGLAADLLAGVDRQTAMSRAAGDLAILRPRIPAYGADTWIAERLARAMAVLRRCNGDVEALANALDRFTLLGGLRLDAVRAQLSPELRG